MNAERSPLDDLSMDGGPTYEIVRPDSFLVASRALADKHGLTLYGENLTLDPYLLEQRLNYCLVVDGSKPPHRQYVAVEVLWQPGQIEVANRLDEGLIDLDEIDELVARDPEALCASVEVSYHLSGYEIPLSEFEGRIRPMVERINSVLGGKPRCVHYSVYTNYEEPARASEAVVRDMLSAPLLDETFNLAFIPQFIGQLAEILRAIAE